MLGPLGRARSQSIKRANVADDDRCCKFRRYRRRRRRHRRRSRARHRRCLPIGCRRCTEFSRRLINKMQSNQSQDHSGDNDHDDDGDYAATVSVWVTSVELRCRQLLSKTCPNSLELARSWLRRAKKRPRIKQLTWEQTWLRQIIRWII